MFYESKPFQSVLLNHHATLHFYPFFQCKPTHYKPSNCLLICTSQILLLTYWCVFSCSTQREYEMIRVYKSRRWYVYNWLLKFSGFQHKWPGDVNSILCSRLWETNSLELVRPPRHALHVRQVVDKCLTHAVKYPPHAQYRFTTVHWPTLSNTQHTHNTGLLQYTDPRCQIHSTHTHNTGLLQYTDPRCQIPSTHTHNTSLLQYTDPRCQIHNTHAQYRFTTVHWPTLSNTQHTCTIPVYYSRMNDSYSHTQHITLLTHTLQLITHNERQKIHTRELTVRQTGCS